MKKYNKFLIRSTDLFNPANFLPVMDEIAMINERTENLPMPFKSEILISFLKEQTLQDDWISANPALTDFVNSGSLFQGSIKFLIESAKGNPVFTEDLENYLKRKFSDTSLKEIPLQSLS